MGVWWIFRASAPLIRGASGIGKSECVLSLIERGYSLVSDDITKNSLDRGRELVGMSADITRFHMEVRGHWRHQYQLDFPSRERAQ